MDPITLKMVVSALPLIKYIKSEVDKEIQAGNTPAMTAAGGGGLLGYVAHNTLDSFRQALNAVGLNTYKQRTKEEAIQLTAMSGRFADKEQALDAMACVAMLYDKHKITRPAEVGGTLITIFGKSVFPDISQKEGALFGKEIPIWEIQKYRTELVRNSPQIAQWLQQN